MSIIETFDPDSHAIINPSQLVNKVPYFPEITVAVINKKFIKLIIEDHHAIELPAAESGCDFPIYFYTHKGKSFAFACLTQCGPGAAGDLEELIAIGANKVLFFGCAGALDRSIAPGQIIIPTEAYRDEGVSYHYIPKSDYATVKTASTLAHIFDQLGVSNLMAKTWTTDAFYRETIGNMKKRKADGCAVVEQECASLMAVGQFREKEIYQFLYAADCLDGEAWDSRILRCTPDETRRQMLNIALEAAVLIT